MGRGGGGVRFILIFRDLRYIIVNVTCEFYLDFYLKDLNGILCNFFYFVDEEIIV